MVYCRIGVLIFFRQIMFPGLLLMTQITAIVLCATLQTSGAETLETPQEVWAGFDPRKEPLNIEKLKEWSEDGAVYQEFYFTAEMYEGQPVRVYALYAAPAGGKQLPGVLHIHGGGQTANIRWLKFWTARGYAALSFDFAGKWDNREKYTDYGKLTYGGWAEIKRCWKTWSQRCGPRNGITGRFWRGGL